MPYSPHIVYGTVTDSSNHGASSANISVLTSLGSVIETADDDGKYSLDLSTVGYVDGETVTLIATDKFNNQIYTESFALSGGYSIINPNLSWREKAVDGVTGYTTRSMLHNIGNKPVTKDNPLPVESIGNIGDYDLVNNPSHVWVVTNPDGQPDSETITLADGDSYTRTFTYSIISGARILTARSAWVKN